MGNSKIKKGFLYYIMIFAFVLFGCACIFASILIFNPGKDVFGLGIKYISHTKEREYLRYTNSNTYIDETNFDTINFQSSNTSFNIEFSDDIVRTAVVINPSIVALSNVEDTQLNVNITLSESALNINIQEPEVWLKLSNKIDAKIIFPKNRDLSNLSLNIKSDSGSIVLGDNNINHHFNVKSVSADTLSGNISLYNNFVINDNNFNIKTTTGLVEINSNTMTGILNIENSNGKINVESWRGDVNIVNHELIKFTANKIGGNVFFDKSLDGYITINSIEGNITTHNTIENTNLTIKSIKGNAVITTTSGFIDINKIEGEALLETKSGYININEICSVVSITTDSGNVTINQYSDVSSTTIKTNKGKIICNLYSIANVSLTSEENNIEIYVKKEIPFILIYECKNGITASWITSSLPNKDTIKISGATDTTTKKVEATAKNGKLYISDKL